MPSSDPITIPKVLSLLMHLDPQSILDIGIGNGRYGFLFRECLDWNFGRLSVDTWQTELDGIEIDPSYLTPIHNYVYNNIEIVDWLLCAVQRRYELIFMGDILEHWPNGTWQQALNKANKHADFVIVVSPNHLASLNQGSWCGHAQEKHQVLLSPQLVGGKCLFANSKAFICAFDNVEMGVFDKHDICL